MGGRPAAEGQNPVAPPSAIGRPKGGMSHTARPQTGGHFRPCIAWRQRRPLSWLCLLQLQLCRPSRIVRFRGLWHAVTSRTNALGAPMWARSSSSGSAELGAISHCGSSTTRHFFFEFYPLHCLYGHQVSWSGWRCGYPQRIRLRSARVGYGLPTSGAPNRV